MRVFIRPLHAEHTRGHLGPASYSSLPLSAQQVYTTDEVLSMLRACSTPSDDVNNMFLDFEGVNIPVENVNELRLVAACACAYHNSLVRENFSSCKDLAGHSYGEPFGLHDQQSTAAEACSSDREFDDHDDPDKYTSCNDDWDEEEKGEEVVYNVNHERHAEVGQPWLATDEEAVEKWGFYL